MILDVEQTESIITQAWIIDIEATKAGTRMWKFFGVTGVEDDANQLKVEIDSEFSLNPQSMLYNLVVSKYKILSPFSDYIISKLEFFWDKKDKNALLNKFYAKAKVEKDSITVADVLISTATVPYKVHVFLPSVFGKLRPGWTQIDVDLAHTPGTSLEMKVNHPGAKFTGFKIAKTVNGNEFEVEWNGEKLGKTDYDLCLRSKMLETTTTLANGRSLTTIFSWNGYSYLNNVVAAEVALDPVNSISVNVQWSMDKLPDLDLSTPEDVWINFSSMFMSEKWGNIIIYRKVEFSSEARRISLNVTGDTTFDSGVLATYSPIKTEVKLTLDVDKAELSGKVKKSLGYPRKEYSIEFHPGLVMPTIKMGAHWWELRE